MPKTKEQGVLSFEYDFDTGEWTLNHPMWFDLQDLAQLAPVIKDLRLCLEGRHPV